MCWAQFDDLSHKSSTSSLNSSRAAPTISSAGSWKNGENQSREPGSPQIGPRPDSTEGSKHAPPSKPPRFVGLVNSSSTASLNKTVEAKPNSQPNVEDEWGQKLYGMQGSVLKR